MKPLRTLLLAAAVALPAAPSVAFDASASSSSDLRRDGPSVLSASERTNYSEVFANIDRSDWAGAAARLAGMRDGPLHAAATAQMYFAKAPPGVSLWPAMTPLRQAQSLPPAAPIGRPADKRAAGGQNDPTPPPHPFSA